MSIKRTLTEDVNRTEITARLRQLKSAARFGSNPQINMNQGQSGGCTEPVCGNVRYCLAVLMSFGTAITSFLRANINTAIHCMVLHKDDNLTLISNVSSIQDIDYNVTNQTLQLRGNSSTFLVHDTSCGSGFPLAVDYSRVGEFTWSKTTQGILLGAMFWGYTAVQIPCGWLAETVGPRKLMFASTLLASLCTVLSPMAARISPWFFLVMRVLSGIFVAPVFPLVNAFCVQWAPNDEISRLLGIVFTGFELGNAMAFPLTGTLCKYGFDGGWPSVFYITGLMGAVWSVFWLILSRDNPGELGYISQQEKDYIQKTMRGHHGILKDKIPWIGMLTSRVVWSLIASHVAFNTIYFLLISELPTYFKEIMNINIFKSSWLSMLPFLGECILITSTGWITDAIIRKRILSRQNARKLMTGLGLLLPGALLVAVGHVDCRDHVTVVALLVLSVSLTGFLWSGGFMCSYVEIALIHASSLNALSNTVSCIQWALLPYIVSILTPSGSKEEWQVVFYITAGILTLGTIIHALFSDTTPQPWAFPQNRDTDDIDINQHLVKCPKNIVQERKHVQTTL